MNSILLLISSVIMSAGGTPFMFGPCKQSLLDLDTGIEIKNKDWESELFLNIHSKQPGKISCARSTRTVELDSSQYAIFREAMQFNDKLGKRQSEFTESYQVTSDHYVFKYIYDKDKFAEVHFKWLKFIPGLLDIHYACSYDDIFAHNKKDFIFIETSSIDPSPTISFQIKDILEENKLNLQDLRMVANCNCFADQPECVDQELNDYLEFRLP